jgi:adenosyl cobinamide kinase/adenosyl cobinamide phosphate guanylyltransferase
MIKTAIAAMMMLACCASFSFAQETSTTDTGKSMKKEAGGQCANGVCPASKMAKKGDCTKCTDGKCACISECPIAKAMKSLPAMTYKVGKESTCCSESATSIAKKSAQPIHYVVAGKTFDDKDTAFASLVQVTEAKVKEFVTPCKCEKSGATKIAGKTCQCSVMAGQTANKVKAAISKVKMTYAVGKESCDCPNHAAMLATKSGEKKEYVVAGEKTCCAMDARLKLARAQYKAAVEATLAKADADGAAKKAETKVSAPAPKVGT